VNEPKPDLCHSSDSDSPKNPDAVEQLQQQLQQQSNEIDRLRVLATTDELTRIANRRRFDEELARCVAEFDRLQREFCVVVIDLDDFKQINDQLGHAAGDRVLVTFAQGLRKHIRATDILARTGGDEFAIIFPATDVESARGIVERARKQMADMLRDAAGNIPVEWSAGFVEMQSGMNSGRLMAAADRFMYSAKHAPRTLASSAKEKPGTRPGLSK
jgi:diguanylate cyclase (GGDEF)-like protein